MLEVAVFVLTGLLAGALEGVALALESGGAVGFTVLGCASLTATPMLFLGVAAWGLRRLERRYRLAAPLTDRLARGLSREEDADRQAVVRFNARFISAAVALAVTARGIGWVLRRMWFSDVPEFAIRFSVGAIVIGVVIAVAAWWLGAVLLERALRKVDERYRLPPPPLGGLRYAIFVALPVFLLIAPFVAEYRDLLGFALSGLLWLVVLATFAGVTRRGLAVLGNRSPRALTVTGWATLVLWAGALGVVIATYDDHPEGASALEGSIGSSLGIDLVRRLSDVDRDGASSWLGGGDCAPWDGKRHPKAREIRGNGIDEDCDGFDPPAVAQQAVVPAQQFSGDLPEQSVRRYNVVWLIVEALRGDHVSALGYDRETTPYIDQLAKESMVFTEAFSQSSRTFFSVPSMMIGLNPGNMNWVREHGVQQPQGAYVTLAERLSAVGYRSRMVLPGGMKSNYTGLQQGFDEVTSYFLDDNIKKWRRTGAPVANAQAIEFIEGAVRASTPFFLTIHYVEPHAPYERHEGGYPDFGDKDADRYDGEVAYVDRHIGALLEYLRYRDDVWDNTIVIIIGDHGEEFGEHGHGYHGRTCFRECTHVPLVFRVPGREPARVETRVALIDILPTLIELLGLSVGDTRFDGQSLLGTIHAQGTAASERPIFCTTASISGHSYLNRAVRVGPLLLTKDVRRGYFELFDTSSDPAAKRNVIDDPRYAKRAEQLKDALSQTEQGNLKQLY